MKHYTKLIAFCIVLCISVSGCGGSSDKESTQASTQQTAEETTSAEDYAQSYAKTYVDRYCHERQGWSRFDYEVTKISKVKKHYEVYVDRDMVDGSKQAFKYKATQVDDDPSGAWEIEELGVVFNE